MSRLLSNHVLLLGLLAMMVLIMMLTLAVPAKIASSLKGLIPSSQTSEQITSASLASDEIIIKLDQIMRSPVSLQQDDPRLINRIRTHHLKPPSTKPYRLTVGEDPSQGQSEAILEIMGPMKGGFFIECGALDGETRSNTLVFEKRHNWRGVLIEGDPKNYFMVLQKNRKAWTVGNCLSTNAYPSTVMFQQHFNVGKISNHDPEEGEKPGLVEVQCLPIFSILLALNVTTVDYFSLDVEGVELEVLKTIPWDKVNIKTLSVEFIHGALGKEALRNYMKDQGYWVYKEVSKSNGWANDFIFVKKSYKQAEDVRADKSGKTS